MMQQVVLHGTSTPGEIDDGPQVTIPLSTALSILRMLNSALDDAGVAGEARRWVTTVRDMIADRVEHSRD
ncbi:hypothetical protein [Jiella sp. M17.18]|uniref:hypothetical protein n=1 Tax=Jiella sp. M17.18 TaxID=3234247 RepID=UPI0034DF0BED